MSKILLKCLDYEADGEMIELHCEIDARGYVDFNEGAHGTATEQGESYKFQLDENGIIDFGRQYEGDRFWRTDLNEVRVRVGTRIKVVVGGPTWNYQIDSVQ